MRSFFHRRHQAYLLLPPWRRALGWMLILPTLLLAGGLLGLNLFFFLSHRRGPVREQWPALRAELEKRAQARASAFEGTSQNLGLSTLWKISPTRQQVEFRQAVLGMQKFGEKPDTPLSEYQANMARFSAVVPQLKQALEEGRIGAYQVPGVPRLERLGLRSINSYRLARSLHGAVAFLFRSGKPNEAIDLLTSVTIGMGKFSDSDGESEHGTRLYFLREAGEMVQKHVPHDKKLSVAGLEKLVAALRSVRHGDDQLLACYDDSVLRVVEMWDLLPQILSVAGKPPEKALALLLPQYSGYTERRGINAHLQHRPGLKLAEFTDQSAAFEKLSKEDLYGRLWVNPYSLRFEVQYRHLELAAARMAILLEIHRLRHGAYPKSLDQLKGEVPEDPFAQGPFVYKVEPGGKCYTLTSHSQWHRRKHEKADFVFHSPESHKAAKNASP